MSEPTIDDTIREDVEELYRLTGRRLPRHEQRIAEYLKKSGRRSHQGNGGDANDRGYDGRAAKRLRRVKPSLGDE